MDAPAPGRWQKAIVEAIREETKTAKTFRLALSQASQYLAGQHFIVRLTAPDGYSASRSYSVASAPVPEPSTSIEITVERLLDGEVSSYLHDVVVQGDELEVRGPIGGYFVWRAETPALLIGGGSGIVPLMSMVRLARALGRRELVRLVVSVRRQDELYYAHELPGPETRVIYTREAPTGTQRAVGHLRDDDLSDVLLPDATAYVCGSSGFADHVTELLGHIGVLAIGTRVERFGPSG